MVHLLSTTLQQNPIKLRLSFHLLQNPSLKTLSQATPPTHLIQYLKDSCHLSPESALSAAKKVHGKIPQNPDSVLTLLRDHGFSKTHIQNLVSKRPEILFFRVKSNLIPKMEFFKATGLPAPVIAEYLSSTPVILSYSLDNRIKPVFDLIRSVSSTHEVFAKMPRHSNCLFRSGLDKSIVPNVILLQNYNVPNDRIYHMFMTNPRILTLNSDRFGEIVRLVNEMGFNPSSHVFMEAVRAMGTLSRATWKSKFEVYRSLGWSDEEILCAFRKNPSCITISEEKIRKGMSFCREELDWGVSVVSRCPVVLLLSLEKRIVPRHKVWQVLKSRGLVKKDSIPLKSFMVSEKQFLEEYVLRHSEMVPHLLKVYHGEIGCTPPVTRHRGKSFLWCMMECTANDNTSEEPQLRSEVEVEHNTSDGNANTHVGETDLNVRNSIRRPSSESQQPTSVDSYVGMEFDSDKAAKSFYNGYARRGGFSIRTSLRKGEKKLPEKGRKRCEEKGENERNEISDD